MKNVSLFLFLLMSAAFARAQKPNWQNLDLQQDSVFGISTEKAYRELLKHKRKCKPVTVGVIDSGVDTAHEDLKAVIWTNPKEKHDGLDGDQDGYTGDVHGWNFIGGPKGNISQENLELTRLIRAGKADSAMLRDYHEHIARDKSAVERYQAFLQQLDSSDKRSDYAKGAIHYFQNELDYYLNPEFNPRSIVGDDTANATERLYGNSDVTGPGPFHGTHVSGIIAADRTNNIGVEGIADHARIMSVRTVPDGDERDKDVANAIRYAADHGARVINMSFGKPYSPEKKVVDDAVKYAMSKDVLLVHAAGNDGKNLDHEPNYPNRIYQDGSGSADAWIEVGASGWKNDSTLVAPFSNWGKTRVDVFAPGVKIHSTIPGSKYGDANGTSMACPVVVGLAALIREYYPKLTAVEVKNIIMQSVSKPMQNIIVKDGEQTLHVSFSEICVSGGIVNAYNALKLAKHYKGHK